MATSANSTATKNPVARMSRRTARRPSAVWIGAAHVEELAAPI
jgi:hypothetical protein